jgi:hypothetical protein
VNENENSTNRLEPTEEKFYFTRGEMTTNFGDTIYVIVEYPYVGIDFEIIFWTSDEEIAKDFIEKNRNSDTFFEYYEVKQLIEW